METFFLGFNTLVREYFALIAFNFLPEMKFPTGWRADTKPLR
jgi:hypothetical protein